MSNGNDPAQPPMGAPPSGGPGAPPPGDPGAPPVGGPPPGAGSGYPPPGAYNHPPPGAPGAQPQGKKKTSGWIIGCVVAAVVGVVGLMVVGILAAVAIPSFLKYTKKAKGSEAIINLRKMSDGARAYFGSEHVGPGGSPLAKQFPRTTPPTPSAAPCASGNPKYIPSARAWRSHPSWRALSFELNDPHYFQYRVVSFGRGSRARFAAYAWANLDCDSTTSQYKIFGRVDVTGEVKRAGPVITNELE